VLQSLFGEPSEKDGLSDIHPKLKWLMFARVVFTTFLLGSTGFLQYRQKDPSLAAFITVLYLLIATIFLLSLLYALVFTRIERHWLFAFIQIGIDSFIVSLIVLITGGFFSLFSFLYLVIIIYASMILYLRGGIALAILCGVQYTVLISLQYYDVMALSGIDESAAIRELNHLQIILKIGITSAACLAVALLSGFLTEQNRKTQTDLRAMEIHVKRVEKMAYMGEMAAGLAHEIKNPLASLVGSIQLLKEELRYDPDHQRLMEIALRETDRLGDLVNEFLIFARPPAGKPQMLRLKEAIEEISGLFEKDTNHAERFSLKKTLVPDILVLMDPAHLRQVLWNLLLNAAEALQGAGTIEIHAVPVKNNEVSIHVRDNGCGMAPETVQKIFDPFFTTKSEGTGLGLSIVHRILEAYDSRLDVQTQLGSGTTFSFNLKRSDRLKSGPTAVQSA
jgi:two-component system, NtrC family, sensor histidine kinase HydH